MRRFTVFLTLCALLVCGCKRETPSLPVMGDQVKVKGTSGAMVFGKKSRADLDVPGSSSSVVLTPGTTAKVITSEGGDLEIEVQGGINAGARAWVRMTDVEKT